ncbi:restriction endonuclease subunit R [Microbacterium sp. 3H14]|uniref:restriction endonuclease subunit R n=1 Tax=unclassified Microbacterium TaxID=2609290 RepID=UPI001068EFA8|nr:restriction endonuclease subunit R [Microbacterium sp. 3H14]TFB15987.1 restriction endonuclease subunit R [Microbacterium sp. 3H14]
MTDPDDWTLTASAFNWTPDVIRAERTAADIAVDIVADGVASAIEVEAGQVWRGFPAPTDTEARELRERLAAVGGRISIVGASIDDWTPDGRRRTDQERYDFLLPQLRAAHHAGALGVRVPIGQPGRELLERLLPVLHDLDLVLFEEAQGQQTPQAQPDAFDAIAALDDPHVRVLLDISMLMPSLPESYIDVLRRGGVDEALVEQLSTAWRAPETHDAVLAAVRGGTVPPSVHTMFMNLIVRFGRSDARDLRGVIPLVAGAHLKFWDLDDTDGRISRPIADLARELRVAGFAGTLCSEWGGHEWIADVTPADATRRHLDLARAALAGI